MALKFLTIFLQVWQQMFLILVSGGELISFFEPLKMQFHFLSWQKPWNIFGCQDRESEREEKNYLHFNFEMMRSRAHS